MFKKPKNLKYTDMAIYIDENVYKESFDEELVFEYLFHLAKMLSFKHALFDSSEKYENFSLYFATRVFLRLTDKKQKLLKPNGDPKLQKVKSVLNFMKKTLYFAKVDFEQEYYSQTISDVEVESTEFTFVNQVQDIMQDICRVDFKCCLNDVVDTCKFALRSIPYKKDSLEYRNIYLSVLLSLINELTFNQEETFKINKFLNKNAINEIEIEKIFRDKEKDSTILWGLPDTMYDFVKIQVRRIKRIISADLSELLDSNVFFGADINNIQLEFLEGDLDGAFEESVE